MTIPRTCFANAAALTALAGFFALVSGCGPGTPSTASDFQTVTTAQNQTTDFAAVKTYALSDTIQTVTDPNDTGASNTPVPADFASQLVARVASNLNALGWTRLTDTTGPKPNVIVELSNMTTTNTSVYYSSWYSYWGGYYGAWYPTTYSSGYAPVGYPVVVNTNVGTLLINMTDPNNPDTAKQKIPSVWVAILNGVLAPTVASSDVQATALTGIDQAFSQSPYLKGSR